MMRFQRRLSVLILASLVSCTGGDDDDSTTRDAGSTGLDATTRDAGTRDAGSPDSGVTDSGIDRDAGTRDGGAGDSGVNPFPTLSDYRICRNDTDCPVGLGECVKTLAYNRADNGTVAVALSDLDARVSAGEGVCSRACTTDETACETLSLRDSTGTPVAFTCQIVAVGTHPYPSPAPSFPFDNQLDTDALALGQPFAALCRPPFELDAAYGDDFCATCDAESACSGLCWRFDVGAAVTSTGATGLCLTSAANGCPIGFETRTLDSGEWCAPILDACSACQDRDGDRRGAGHCALTEIDCNDRDAVIYYDPNDPAHAFPTHCGEQDFNCNGLSDADEQVGDAAYASYHCEFCYDDADGDTVLAGTAAEASLACVGGAVTVTACADANRVHCTGDPRVVGCETTAGGAVTYYRDADGDDFGDPNVTSLGCPAGTAPSGFVANDEDCNDADPNIHPGVVDLCECWGDCATTGARVDNDCDQAYDEDVTGYVWSVDPDGDGAASPPAPPLVPYCGAPTPNHVISTNGLDCNESSTTQYGAHLRVADATGVPLPLPITVAPPRDASGELYVVQLMGYAEICDTIDNDCDNSTDEGVTTTFYVDGDSDNYGLLGSGIQACTAPVGYVAVTGDCNDGNPNVNPGATELCNNVDDDCANGIDDGVPSGGACGTGLLGICATGTLDVCTSGVQTCIADATAQRFDDPDPSTPSDEDCDGPETALYVDPNGSDTNPGTQSAPFQTIGAALAAGGVSQIYLVGGQHSISAPINMISGIDVVGGWQRAGNTWTWTGAQTTINHDGSVNGNDEAVAVQFSGDSSTLAHVNITMQPASVTGASHYGIHVVNGNLARIQDVTVTVPSGTNGANGGNGAAGTAGGPSGIQMQRQGHSKSCANVDGSTTNVSGGNGGLENTQAGTAGFGPGAGAGNGGRQPGFDGGNGGGGNGATAGLGRINGNFWRPQSSMTTPSQGGHAGGGGGGSAGPLSAPNGSGGGGGSGGCGGFPGENGQPGGSSFALFAINAGTMEVEDCTFSAGGGGTGGNGGRGGNGGNGGTHYRELQSGIGADGGDGGYAGGGGGGAGAAGGSSYSVFQRGSSDLCPNLVNVINNTPGTPGTGGSAGNGGSGARSNGGSAGGAGPDGYQVGCFWSRPCGQGCAANETCVSGYCYR